jgi:hypothetical protein
MDAPIFGEKMNIRTAEEESRLAELRDARAAGLPIEWKDVDWLLSVCGYAPVRRKRCERCNANGCKQCGGRGYVE